MIIFIYCFISRSVTKSKKKNYRCSAPSHYPPTATLLAIYPACFTTSQPWEWLVVLFLLSIPHLTCLSVGMWHWQHCALRIALSVHLLALGSLLLLAAVMGMLEVFVTVTVIFDNQYEHWKTISTVKWKEPRKNKLQLMRCQWHLQAFHLSHPYHPCPGHHSCHASHLSWH